MAVSAPAGVARRRRAALAHAADSASGSSSTHSSTPSGLPSPTSPSATTGQFVGTRNFAYVIAWPQFSTAIYNTVVFTVCAIAIKFVLGMAVALVLNQQIRGRNFFRAFLLLPWVMPAFVVYLVWRWLYDPLSGLINYALIDLGLIASPIAFLSNRETAMASVDRRPRLAELPLLRDLVPRRHADHRPGALRLRAGGRGLAGRSSSATSRCPGSTRSSGWCCC